MKTIDTLPLGATAHKDGVRYTAWCPDHEKVSVLVEDAALTREVPLSSTKDGFFSGLDKEGNVGDRYRLRIDNCDPVPDIASRFQPDGAFGPSQVVDPAPFVWKASAWKRPSWKGQVVYELHVGTFTEEGTFKAASSKLAYIKDLGATAVELLPVGECSGQRNWGYDTVFLFAPMHAYGTPDDMRAFIDECHRLGLAVILDVVYNHIGAFGDVTGKYTSRFVRSEKGDWGKGFNLDEPGSAYVRGLLMQNLRYWLEEFRIDGFRFDATHSIVDRSSVHWLQEAVRLVQEWGAFVIAEDNRNSRHLIDRAEANGLGFDAVWADDFHHSLRVSQTGEKESYLGCYSGSAVELADILNHGWHYRGKIFPLSGKPRGGECDRLPAEQFVYCLSNHDQVGNRALGERLNHVIDEGRYRAISLLFLLVPYTPMLFMGQEWSASTPFLFFTDHPRPEGDKIAEGRREEFRKSGLNSDPFKVARMPDPQEENTFRRSKLNWSELGDADHTEILDLYRAGLGLRRELFSGSNPPRGTWKAWADNETLFLRYTLPGRQVEVRFGAAVHLGEGERILLRSGSPSALKKSRFETVILEMAGQTLPSPAKPRG